MLSPRSSRFLLWLVFSALGLGGSTINSSDVRLGALLVSFVGAVILLGIVTLVRRGTVR